MPRIQSTDRLVHVLARTYDALPKLAEAFLSRAINAGLSFDLDGMLRNSTITYPSATVTFLWCHPSDTSSRGLILKSSERDFDIWFETPGSVTLKCGETQVYSQRPLDQDASGDAEFSGDSAVFINVAQFILAMTPDECGVPVKIE